MNDLYGSTLNGLIKGGGIRLSYSKNPLGVRTPTSASTSMQQQQPLPHYAYHQDSYIPRHYPEDARAYRGGLGQGLSSPPPHSASGGYGGSYMMSSPPPRFSAPSTAAFQGPTASASSAYLPRSGPSYDYGVPSSASLSSSGFSPFTLSTPPHSSTIPDHHHPAIEHEHHFLHGALSSPPLGNHVETARVG